MSFSILVTIIVIALIFDFLNGFHDSANSIATVVSTRVLSPRVAVVWAAFFNMVAAFFFDVHVATTIGKGVVHTNIPDAQVIFAGLMAAIIWNLLTWYWGLPSSSSHTLVGGFAGAAVVKGGWAALIPQGLIKIASFIVIAPVLGFVLGWLLMVIVMNLFQRSAPDRIDRWFRRGQLFSAALYSLGHGTNDAQKTMGIILILLISAGRLPPEAHVPIWVIVSCHLAIGIGTLFGGWRIVKTMGHKMAKLRPVHGFCAETAGAVMLVGTAIGGIPVSTTHVITGGIMGVGATQRASAVKWGVAHKIIWAWILTIPVSFLIGASFYGAVKLLFGPA